MLNSAAPWTGPRQGRLHLHWQLLLLLRLLQLLWLLCLLRL